MKRLILIKIGGTNIDNEKVLKNIIDNIALLSTDGYKIIVVHGGSKQIDREMLKSKIKIIKIKGERYTNKKTLKILDKCCKIINDKITCLINNKKNLNGFALHGQNNFLLVAQKSKPDLGLVGKISNIYIDELLFFSKVCIPVISPMIMDKNKKLLNVNADNIAESIATALKVDKLIFVSDIDGIIDNNQKIISFLNLTEATKLIGSNTISGGMIPKLSGCIRAIQNGVSSVSIINGFYKDALTELIIKKQKIGTTIIPHLYLSQ